MKKIEKISATKKALEAWRNELSTMRVDICNDIRELFDDNEKSIIPDPDIDVPVTLSRDDDGAMIISKIYRDAVDIDEDDEIYQYQLGELSCDELLQILDIIIETKEQEVTRKAKAYREQLKQDGFFEFEGHLFRRYASLPKKYELCDVNMGRYVQDYLHENLSYDEFYSIVNDDTDIFRFDGYDTLVIPSQYGFIEFHGMRHGKKINLKDGEKM